MMSSALNQPFKVVLLGDSGVGKSNIHSRFLKGFFCNSHKPTIGVDYGVVKVDVGDQQLTINLWDTAGQERFKSLTDRIYLKNAKGVVFTFDVTQRHTFENILRWLHLVDSSEVTPKDVAYMLVGNKTDLAESRVISRKEGVEFAERHSMIYIETSARTGENISQVFKIVAVELQRRQRLAEKRFEINNNNHNLQSSFNSSSLTGTTFSNSGCCNSHS